MGFIFLLCAFLLFSTMVIKILKKSYIKNNSKLKLPPGPKPLPIIGNVHQLSGGLIHHVLRDLAKKYGPLMHLRVGEVPTVIVSSPEVAREVFKTHDILFAQRPSNVLAIRVVSYNYTDIIASPYGDYWRQLRKICVTEILSLKRVQTFRSIREEEVLNLLREISLNKGSTINLSRRIFSLTLSITTRAAFGEKIQYQEKVMQLLKEINQMSAGFNIGDLYPSLKLLEVFSGFKHKLEKIQKQIDEILGHIVNEHKEKITKPKQDTGEVKEHLVDVLLRIQKSGEFEPPLTDNNIKAVLFDIFGAGSDTSSTAVEWAMSEIIRNPRVMKEAQDEIRKAFDERGNVDESSLDDLKYLQAIVKETLRLHPSAPLLLPRECTERCEISGFEIPAKATVMVNAWAIGRDPIYWIEAEKFKPERFLNCQVDYKGNDFEYIPFGAGRRICPGISYALPNMMLPLAQLLFHFDWKLSNELNPEELDMSESVGVAVRRKDDLCLIPIPYSRSSLA